MKYAMRSCLEILAALVTCLFISSCSLFQSETAVEEIAVAQPAIQTEETAAQPEQKTLHILVDVPEDTGTVYLPGSLDELGPWIPNHFAMEGTGTTREAMLSVEAGTEVEFKFTLGSWAEEAINADYTTIPNYTVQVDDDVTTHLVVPQFRVSVEHCFATLEEAGIVGSLDVYRDVASEKYDILPRHVLVWLPPGYRLSGNQRFPVLYMHDGQNIIDPRMSHDGVDWGIDETIVSMIQDEIIPPMIVVGVFNTDERREDYVPFRKGDQYAKFLVEELKPMIDATYRTLPDRENTGVMGSSLGGLISLYIGWKHPDVFSKAGCLSSYLRPGHIEDEFGDMVGEQILLDLAADGPLPDNVKFYFDYGTDEDILWELNRTEEDYIAPHRELLRLLDSWGWENGKQYMFYVEEGGIHGEQWWRERLHIPMKFLFGMESTE